MPNGITVTRDGSIARAYAARQAAVKLATEAEAERGVKYLIRPQADGSVLMVNGPKYENVWAESRAATMGITVPRRKRGKAKR